ncbi:MAG: hypothetical protein KDJ38_14195, partial [Gammaproteobacteria bacterium]|nr:hypothetical protein [Gammaproteobacteria bacterium]
MKKTLAALVLLFCSSTSFAAGLDLALSNESANLALLFNPPGASVNNSQISVGALFNDLDDLVFYGSIMALGPGKYEENYYSLGAGVKLYGGDLDIDQSVGALAIGARAGFYILPHPVNPVDVVVEGFFAPGITSASDTEKLWEFAGRLQVEIVRSARAYVGYRLMKIDKIGRA